jgi:hypothetical protein
MVRKPACETRRLTQRILVIHPETAMMQIRQKAPLGFLFVGVGERCVPTIGFLPVT